MTTAIVILGAGYAGLLIAQRLAHSTGDLDVHITLVNDAPVFADRIQQHEHAVRALPARSIADTLQNTGVAFVFGRVTRIDLDGKRIHIVTEAGTNTLSYDRLVYALGSFTDPDAVPGICAHALTFSRKNAEALREKARALAAHAGQLLVCGGGLSGIEAAAECAEAFPTLRVTLVTRGVFAESASPAAQRYLRRAFERLGIRLCEQTHITRLEAGCAETPAGAIPFDACLWAGSFTVPALAREAGLRVNARGQAMVDDHFHALAHPDVMVVGDAAQLTGAAHAHVRMACATATAMALHAVAGLDAELRGNSHTPFRMRYAARNISLGRRDAVIDLVHADDSPRNYIVTGRMAALWKNAVAGLVWRITSGRMPLLTPRAKRRVIQRTENTQFDTLTPMPTSDASSVVALAQFEEQRPRLFAIAYRMLGSAADADDVLQDCFLRWRNAHNVQSAHAFLTTVVTRLCLDRLKSAQTRRETYIGPWLPEPILTQPDEAPERAEMSESITVAFLALLERLNPVERAVFLLREVFDYDYAEIALFVDKSEAACRQIFSRAQKYVRDNRPRLPPNAAAHQRVLGIFLNALASGDLDGLTQILHESVVSYGDGGGKAFAAKAPIHGRAAVAKFMVGLRRTAPAGLIPGIEHVNGQLALVLRLNGTVFSVLAVETDGQYIYGLRSIVNPDKLGRV